MTSPDLDPRTARSAAPAGEGAHERPVALVTGSESGIGRATAVALAADGFAGTPTRRRRRRPRARSASAARRP